MLTVLASDSQEAWTTDTCSSLPQTRVTVWAMLNARLVTVPPPQTNRTWFTTPRTLRGRRHNENLFSSVLMNILSHPGGSEVLAEENSVGRLFSKMFHLLSKRLLSSKWTGGNPRFLFYVRSTHHCTNLSLSLLEWTVSRDKWHINTFTLRNNQGLHTKPTQSLFLLLESIFSSSPSTGTVKYLFRQSKHIVWSACFQCLFLTT